MNATSANPALAPASRLVLVIDDDADVVKSIQACLRSTGWTIETTLDAREGLDLAVRVRPDVVLCDASMPELSGPRVIELLKQNPATSGIPVVLMSGYADPAMFSRVPWTVFLAKPFSPQELRAALENAVSNKTPRNAE